MKSTSMGYVVVAFCLAALICSTNHAIAAGYDANAPEILKQVLEKVEFRPVQKYGRSANRRFGPTKPDPAEASRRLQRAAELVTELRMGNYHFLSPIEKGDSLTALPTYQFAQNKCSDEKTWYWHVPTATAYEEGKFTEFEDPVIEEQFARKLIPYAPGHPRPVDYENLYVSNSEKAKARGGYALYEIPAANSAEPSDTVYVLRAEDYIAGETASDLLYPILPGSMSAFRLPSCSFVGTLDFYNYYIRLSTRTLNSGDTEITVPDFQKVEGEYIAEIMEISDQVFAVVLEITPGAKRPGEFRYLLTIWNLGIGGDSDGSWYVLSSPVT